MDRTDKEFARRDSADAACRRLRGVAYDMLTLADAYEAQSLKIDKLESELATYREAAEEAWAHGRTMHGQMLKTLLTPGVVPSLVAAEAATGEVQS